jgi:hypothetical protein
MRNTNWKDIAELIGIAAIVASLVAVVVELRQTKSALIASTYQARAFDAVATNLSIAENERLLDLITTTDRGRNSAAVDALTDSERRLLRLFLVARMADLDNEHYQFEAGLLDEEFLTTNTRRMIASYAPGWRAIGVRENRASFRALVDDVLDEKSD